MLSTIYLNLLSMSSESAPLCQKSDPNGQILMAFPKKRPLWRSWAINVLHGRPFIWHVWLGCVFPPEKLAICQGCRSQTSGDQPLQGKCGITCNPWMAWVCHNLILVYTAALAYIGGVLSEETPFMRFILPKRVYKHGLLLWDKPVKFFFTVCRN